MSKRDNKEEPKKEEWIQFRVSPELKKNWVNLCKVRGETEAYIGRKLVEEAIQREGAEVSVDYISIQIRKAIQDVLKPHINRLAALNAKTAMTSGTSMYLLLEVLNGLGIKDVVGKYEKARIKSVANLKAKESDVNE